MLARDSLDFMDALSYHVYWSPAVTEPAAPGELTFIEQEVGHFVELMSQRGQRKPIYMTEGGLRARRSRPGCPRKALAAVRLSARRRGRIAI